MIAIKAKPMLIKLRTDLDKYLRDEVKRAKKKNPKTATTMVGIIEELLEYRRQFKSFPPK